MSEAYSSLEESKILLIDQELQPTLLILNNPENL